MKLLKKQFRQSQSVEFLVYFLTASLTAVSGLATEYGEFSVDSRLRFESAEADGLEDADNLSLRIRIGYATPEYRGLKAMVEGEFTGVADEGSYNAAGVHGDRDKAVIADPKNAQLDQAYVDYTINGTTTKIGRQRIVLDNARFVGDVAWRQNRQTFDAASIKSTSIEKLSLFYAFMDNVVRIFGSEAPSTGANAREAESSSHLANVSYSAHKSATITGYAYLLDLDKVPSTFSADTFGVYTKGSIPVVEHGSLGYYAEYAYQEDAGDNPLNYEADYYHGKVTGSFKEISVIVGYEVLGSDDTGSVDDDGAPVFTGFKTPLATLHKFNGFADRFLNTPDKGLEDVYVMLGYRFMIPGAGPLTANVWHHDFSAEKGDEDLGDEWDALFVKPFEIELIPGSFKALVKLAFYEAGDSGADTDRLSAELNYAVTF